jgi:sentrin-specific protease 1
VRSFNPFKIEISVKDLQNILTINQDMILRCFDMDVRLLANKESRRPKEEIINNRKHYMDMRFWVSLFAIINVLIYNIYI